MKPQLPADIASLDQLDMAIAELVGYIAARRQMRIRSQVSHLSNVAVQCSEELAALIKVNQIKLEDEASLEALGQSLADYRHHAPRLTLVLAAAPAPALRRRLGDWLRSTVGSGVLLNIRVASEIGGGVVIQTPNHVYDHSFRRRVLDNRPKLLEIIQNVR